MEPLKHILNIEVMHKISKLIKEKNGKFNHSSFLKNSKESLDNLELKDRVQFIALKLKESFSCNYLEAIETLSLIQKKNHPSGLSKFELWPITEFVSRYGLDYLKESLEFIGELTIDFTGEFAIREYLLKDFKKVKIFLDRWSVSKCEHKRRLVSEGTRPYLPWGKKLEFIEKNPDLVWGLIERLKNDDSIYVRKSVANHINDLTKKNSDFVLKKLIKWNRNEEVDWIINHGLRTLIKKGDERALDLIGVNPRVTRLLDYKIDRDIVKVGENQIIRGRIKNLTGETQKIVVDVEVHLLKSNGSHNIKCFKGKKFLLDASTSQEITVKIPFKKVTTRKYYPGKHLINLIVNGKKSKEFEFKLKL